LREHYEPVRTACVPAAAEIALLHKALSIQSQEFNRIQAVRDEVYQDPEALRAQETERPVSRSEVLDEVGIREFMVTQAQRAAPWLRQLSSYVETDLKAGNGRRDSAAEAIEGMSLGHDAKNFALCVVAELRSLEVEIVCGRRWICSFYPDGCSAFWLAHSNTSAADNWATYGLFDVMECGGVISSGANAFEDPVGGLELIGFLVTVFERRHWHLSRSV
jgi:hypothetical protein